jgi:hypothetical protein
MTTQSPPADTSPGPGPATSAVPEAVPAPPSWPWRRGALLLAGAAPLITISALTSADLCVPKTLSASCDQAIFVDQAASASLSSDAVVVEVDWFGQRFQRRGAVQGAVRPVLIVVVGLVLAQDPSQMGRVPDEGAVQELAAASADPPFGDRVHARGSRHPQSRRRRDEAGDSFAAQRTCRSAELTVSGAREYPGCHHAHMHTISDRPRLTQPPQCLTTAHHQQVLRCVTASAGASGASLRKGIDQSW